MDLTTCSEEVLFWDMQLLKYMGCNMSHRVMGLELCSRWDGIFSTQSIEFYQLMMLFSRQGHVINSESASEFVDKGREGGSIAHVLGRGLFLFRGS